MAEVKRIDIAEFRREGYLQEVNRRFFHPLGLALEVVVEDDGSERLGGVRDYRTDAEGIYFAGELADLSDKADNVDRLWQARETARHEALGYMVQPTGRYDAPAKRPSGNLPDASRPERIARLVAESWRDAAMRWGDLPMEGRVIAHPLACVLAALDGETDPIELGIAPTDAFFERIREALLAMPDGNLPLAMPDGNLPPRQSRVVWKFQLRAWSIFLDMPKNAELLHVGVQGLTAYVWALCDPDAPKVSRLVASHPTGVDLPPALDRATYVGTFTLNEGGGPLVFHVFDGGERDA